MIAEIFVVDATPGPKAQKHIDECVKQNVCLCGCGRVARRRGLADRCYYAFNRAMISLPKKEAAKYEAGLIRKGLVLAAGMHARIKRRINVYARTADEIATENE